MSDNSSHGVFFLDLLLFVDITNHFLWSDYTIAKHRLQVGILNKIIIISGVGGYGKTTAIHTIFDKFENENTKIIYDRRNQNDWIRIKSEDFYYNDSEFVVIDNFRELKQEELNDIEASIKNKRIVLICRESHVSTLNEYTTHLNVNDFGFKWVENDVEEKILKVLPSFLKVPLYYNLLSNFTYNTEDVIKYINDHSKNEHQHEFIIGLLDIVFSNLPDESKNLLTIFAMVVSDSIYYTPHLEYLLREIDLETYESNNKNILNELNLNYSCTSETASAHGCALSDSCKADNLTSFPLKKGALHPWIFRSSFNRFL